jgi:hypothetical protein
VADAPFFERGHQQYYGTVPGIKRARDSVVTKCPDSSLGGVLDVNAGLDQSISKFVSKFVLRVGSSTHSSGKYSFHERRWINETFAPRGGELDELGKRLEPRRSSLCGELAKGDRSGGRGRRRARR